MIQLFNVTGELIKTIADKNPTGGKHPAKPERSTNATGNYFLKINTVVGIETEKTVITE